MAHLINPHVERLSRHLPTKASPDLFEERVGHENAFTSIPTRALETVQTLVATPGTQLVVLTGDAGHGKTHLCRVLLESDYGLDTTAAREALRRHRDGKHVHPPSHDRGRPLRVVPDLSEIEPIDEAVATIRSLLDDESAVGLVCANEGRLRDVVAQRDEPRFGNLLKTLEEGIRRGVTTLDNATHVVNMNFQSVARLDGSFVDQIVAAWAIDRRRWTTCKNCDAAPRCPIFANHQHFVAEDSRRTRRRREGLEQLLRILERAGHVLTIRDTLSLCAYAITGGLDCQSVGKKQSRSRVHHLDQVLFKSPRHDDAENRLPALVQLRRLDPGRRAMRGVDEELSRLEDQRLVSGDYPSRFSAPPRTAKEAKSAAKKQRDSLRRARRTDFFDLLTSESPDNDEYERARRLGFGHYRDFAEILGGDASPADLVEVRNRVVDGFHVVQGIRPESETHFFLTDPAFARAGGRAPVIARQIGREHVQLLPLERTWESEQLERAIDWLPRLVVVRFGDEQHGVELDLVQFEIVMRAAGGVTFREFHAPTIRRIVRQLARLASDTARDGIRVVDGADVRSIHVDHGTFKVGSG